MSRNIALDILKLTMALMIVGIHAGFLYDVSPLGNYILSDGLFRMAVPIFFIINGYYFHSVLLKKNQFNWLKRVIILHIFWTVIYSYYWIENSDFSFFIILIKELVIGYHHLWYLPAIFGAAIIVSLINNWSSTSIILTITLTFISAVSMQYSALYHFFEGTPIDKILNYEFIYRNFLFFSFPFFCLGYLIKKHNIHNEISLKLTCILSVLGLILLFFESYLNYKQYNRDGSFNIYLSLMLCCPFIFILFLKIDIQHKSKNISLYSASIYFIHTFILNLYSDYTEITYTLLTLVTIMTSVVASYFILKLHKRFNFIL